MSDEIVIRCHELGTRFGSRWIHRHLDLEVRAGEILAIVGGSGSGKTTLLRSIIGLNPIAEGRIEVLGQSLQQLDGRAGRALRQRWGVLFQLGALFSALTVFENIAFPLREWGGFRKEDICALVALKLNMVGLQPEDADKLPAELSGGMVKRVALARALALDAEILFLDEPTSGLDPIAAADFDQLLRQIQADIGLTVVMISHDLESIAATANRVAVLSGGKVLSIGPLQEVAQVDDPYVRDFFHGTRGEHLLQDVPK
ncbi:ATP-binding cassette domain-containing protein [Igneacidithiobacillus siniensis]|uniref:ABC transporter ATP-binding protein n=1 Tax=Acidithiobacillus TaxID=119977 RepID=UPI00201033DD|nr:ATP-binding cassette domain-containing protein [Acidithiobacillus sp. S30A2]